MSSSASWRSTVIFVYKQKNDENLIGNKTKTGMGSLWYVFVEKTYAKYSW